ncbi:CHRD domain-containing protein [Candidatus Nitrospira bockiana]
MQRPLLRFTCLLVVLLAAPQVDADTILFANMTNAQENPPALPTTTATGASRPASFGTASFILNDARTALSFSSTIVNIDVTGSQTTDPNDNLVAAHIHASPTVTPTTNAPVVWGFFGTPFNDNNPNDVAVTPFATGVGGTISGKWDAVEGNNTTLAAQVPNILGGRSYINFHTTQFPGGEIRGTLTIVPEPSTLLLIVTGLAALGLARRLGESRDCGSLRSLKASSSARPCGKPGFQSRYLCAWWQYRSSSF